MTTTTFYSATGTDSPCDGYVGRTGLTNATWGDVRDGAGNDSGESDASIAVLIHAHTSADRYQSIRRGIFLYNTASIGSDDISSATWEFVATLSDNAMGGSHSMTMVASSPAANDDLVNADYAQVAAVDQATDLTIAGLTVDSSTFNVFTLNAAGLASIDKAGISKFGARVVADADDNEAGVSWSSGGKIGVTIAFADEALAGDKRPKLVVIHAAAPVTTFLDQAIMF